ncbi:MAG TPA: ABC transporter permease [Verrucomicrobiae bacterium]|nr:ABC transporter permease [Verrucomicrobiae bacterium]
MKRRNLLLGTGSWMLAVVVLAALLAGVASPHGPTEQLYRDLALAPPSWAHWIGVDDVGRDVLTRILYGARATLGIALGATAIALVGGVALGAIAGTWRGWFDALITHITDFLLAFPSILLGLAALTILTPSPISVAIAVGISSLPTILRQVRAAFVSENAREYVLAARATGAGPWRIAVLEILPNCAGLILALTTLTLGGAVLEAAGLAFLGLSGQPDIPEWGMMLREEQGAFRIAPWLCIAPGLAITWTVLAFNLLSDGLRQRQR